MNNPAILGAGAALAAAAAWAFGTVLWRKIGDVVSPLSMNLNKSLICLCYLAVASLLFGFEPVDGRTSLYLAVSGVLGIALADSFFLSALILLGARNTALVGTLSPILTTLAAVAVLGEHPRALVWLGACLTVAGIAWVLRERSSDSKCGRITAQGLGHASLSLAFTAAGTILAKKGAVHAPALEGTFIRMLGGTLALLLWITIRRGLRDHLRPLRDSGLLKQMSLVVLISTFGGYWLSLAALKYTDASIVAILSSTTPLFVLPLIVLLRREKISATVVVGTVVAVAGVALVVAALPD